MQQRGLKEGGKTENRKSLFRLSISGDKYMFTS